MNLFGLNITVEKAPKDTRPLHEKLSSLGASIGSGIGKGIEKTAEVTQSTVKSTVEAGKAAIDAYKKTQTDIATKRAAVVEGVAEGSKT
jgi:hypothetical protein